MVRLLLLKKNFIFSCILCLIPSFSGAQNFAYGNEANASLICSSLEGIGYKPSSNAVSSVDEILKVIGAKRRFQITACSNINNALAVTVQGVRYIMYDPEWMYTVARGDDWRAKYILAHEIGHHINGHTVDVLLGNTSNSRITLVDSRIQELEADEFAGFVLGRLGATEDEALLGVLELPELIDDTKSTHPARFKRMGAVKEGFKNSGGENNSKDEILSSPYSNFNISGVYHTILNDFYPDATYKGYVSKSTNEPMGWGQIFVKGGQVYEGEVFNGVRQGYGTLKYPNGEIWEGEWIDGLFTRGTLTTGDGRVNVGNFVYERGDFPRLDGKGSMRFPSGEVLEGEWSMNSLIFGTSFYPDDEAPQPVGLVENKYDGWNTYRTGNRSYSANYEDGLLKLTKPVAGKAGYNRRRYTPTLCKEYRILDYYPEDVLRELDLNYSCEAQLGYIEQYQRNIENVVYRGYALRVKGGTPAKRTGFGIMNFDHPEIESSRSYYVGMWANDGFNGYGLLVLKDGTQYKGVFKDHEFIREEDFNLTKMISELKDW